jgi:hypothetical protein
LLLMNDDLIKSFKVNRSGSTTKSTGVGGGSGSATSSSSLISASETMGGTSQQSSHQEIKSFILVKFDKTTKNTILMQVNRVNAAAANKDELREECSSSGSNEFDAASFSKLSVNKTYLNFSMNLLTFAFWESIFIGKEKDREVR